MLLHESTVVIDHLLVLLDLVFQLTILDFQRKHVIFEMVLHITEHNGLGTDLAHHRSEETLGFSMDG